MRGIAETGEHHPGSLKFYLNAQKLALLESPRGESGLSEPGRVCVSIRAMDTAAEFVGAKRVGFSGPPAYIDALETKQTIAC